MFMQTLDKNSEFTPTASRTHSKLSHESVSRSRDTLKDRILPLSNLNESYIGRDYFTIINP